MVEIGVFVVPGAGDHERTVAQVLAAEEAGLDLVAIQDHPYQRSFLDTFMLLANLAGRTSRIRLAPDVANLPLRQPAMLAKAAASIDLLSGGRGDGWLPSLGYLPEEEMAERHTAIDEAARAAGRDPSEVRRVLNVGVGEDWDGSVERLAALVTERGFETLIVSVGQHDPVGFVRRVGEE